MVLEEIDAIIFLREVYIFLVMQKKKGKLEIASACDNKKKNIE